MQKVLVIFGPTAVGKTNISVELAKKLDGEIISADSMQIYKGLDIGSAKVTDEEKDGITHYLIDIKSVDEEYSACEFCNDAKEIIREIVKKGKTPIICGGTGLYIKSLIDNYNFGQAEKNIDIRKLYENYSNEEIFELVKKLPEEFKLYIGQNDRKRAIRAIEMYDKNHTLNKHTYKDEEFEYILFALTMDRQKLYDRINYRVDVMMGKGILDEAKMLLKSNVNENSLCMKAIGYKELFPYIKGEKTLDECLNQLKQNSRNYAKRQFTFMNQFKDSIKVDASDKDNCIKEIYKIFKEKK